MGIKSLVCDNVRYKDIVLVHLISDKSWNCDGYPSRNPALYTNFHFYYPGPLCYDSCGAR